MTAEKLDALLARQMSDAEKRARAHFVVDSSRSFDSARAQVHGILRAVAALAGAANRIRRTRMREIVFDTETTGLDPYQGDRLVEIGCVELVNGFPTGNSFHRYLNPERDMPDGAFKVHGLSIEFLKDKPLFADVCEEFLAFVGDAPLVAHNAMFDLGFINAELERCKRAAAAARPAGRHADAGAAALSGRAEQARRSVRALLASTRRAAPSTARCSMPSCSPRSMSS